VQLLLSNLMSSSSDHLVGWAFLNGLPVDGPMPHHFHAGHPTPWSEGLVVRFENADGTHWVGNFQQGSGPCTEVTPWPESNSILVNAGGFVYLIDTANPTEYRVLGTESATTALNSDRSMLFVATHYEVRAYRRDRNLAWCSKGLGGLIMSVTASDDSISVAVEEELGEPLVIVRLAAHDGMVLGREYSSFILFLHPWKPIAAESGFGVFFERELDRELGPDDPLRQHQASCIAKNFTCDDVLFHLDDGTLAEVRLTFPKNPPEGPGWPRRRTFDTLADWALASMIPVHEVHFGLHVHDGVEP